MDDNRDNAMLWCGKPIEEMTREELIRALKSCAMTMQSMREAARKEREFFAASRRAAE